MHKIVLMLLAFVPMTILAQSGNGGDMEITVKVEKEYKTPKQPEAIDMGGRVLWASFNLFAETPVDVGVYVGWGDPNGELKFQASNPNDENYLERTACLAMYGGLHPPYNISGTDLDIAKRFLGNGWRLPDETDFDELAESCKWEIERRNNWIGYKVTASNGNSIFLPAWDDEIVTEDGIKYVYGAYWTGRMFEFPIDEYEDGAYVYALDLAQVLQRVKANDMACTPFVRWLKFMVRPVKSK